VETERIQALLERVAAGRTAPDEALRELRWTPVIDTGFAQLDTHRHLRTGTAEVVYGQGKSASQVAELLDRLAASHPVAIATRASPEQYAATVERVPSARYFEDARIIAVGESPGPTREGKVAVLAAGTADLPVAEEAAVTLGLLGDPVERVYDVGVAGLHRLLGRRESLQSAAVLIVVAGMEGALPSVVAGLLSQPVIAVPTSIGYGASFGGLAALLAMLNSCATGIAVVNIDNGFGAACFAHRINR
jgi:NCAIR mutase (PurE)-related protein